MKKNPPIDVQLQAAQVAIHNAQSMEQVAAALAPFGYDAARLQAAEGLLEETRTAVGVQALAYGEQYEATAVLRAAREEANRVYMNAVKIARIAFRQDVQARATLRLAGRREQGLAGWLAQATMFYQNLLDSPTLLAGMRPFGYDEAQLAGELALVRAVETANQRQKAAKGAAQAATQARDEKLRALRVWLSDFWVIAPIALADHSQLMESLGKVVP
ncbi:MAG: hypothetical protein H6662_13795 [Ardenticatenaceae bacterium]|nr:hypothetical protein [Ardenticatenaceae bacterium]MCB9003637.1 hypothetical protein [Ardenticatenaceae bacterium]